MRIDYWRIGALAFVLLGAVLAAACGGSNMMTPACMEGAEACPCYGNQTCNPGLTCLSNLCVNSSSGNGGTSGGGVSGTAGTTGAGGGGGTSSTCPVGAERCACYGNNTCDGTLACLSNHCVSLTSGSAGTTGGAGATGTAGATGAAGATGVAGSTGAGGSGSGNLIKNGDFSLGKEYWDLTYQAGEVAGSQYSGGEYCVFNLSTSKYLSFSLGYPPTPSDAFVIAPGATYTLSYRAMATATTVAATVEVKIGHAVTPYTLVYSVVDHPNAAYQNFTHQILSAPGDTAAGLVFNGTLDYYSYACFDDIVLVKN